MGFWPGNPWEETKEIYCQGLGIEYAAPPRQEASLSRDEAAAAAARKGKADVDLAAALGSDMYWYAPELDPSSWRHPDGKPMFDCDGGKPKESLSQPGVLASSRTVGEVEKFDWPDPRYLDFGSTLEVIDYARSRGMAVAGGMWTPFFHVLCDLFGMENYFVKMYTEPALVEAATERLLRFYMEANRRFLDLGGEKIDLFFFGNDLGSQNDLLISPDAFDRFVLPGISMTVELAKSYGLPVMVHSCGAVSKIIPRLIDAGVDALHPLQARAAGMGARELAERFRDDLVFVGGVDTQDLLPFRPAAAVRDEVRRLIDLFGSRFIVSPSHEALLPNVAIEKVLAMRDALPGKDRIA